MHRAATQRDAEIAQFQVRVQDYEKRLVLIQKSVKEHQLVEKMNKEAGISQAQLKSLMMPFSSSSAANMSVVGGGGFAQAQGFGGGLYNQKVYKPIRGGGAGQASNTPGQGGAGVSFGDFMQN